MKILLSGAEDIVLERRGVPGVGSSRNTMNSSRGATPGKKRRGGHLALATADNDDWRRVKLGIGDKFGKKEGTGADSISCQFV